MQARLERLLAPGFYEFGTSGGEIGYEGTAAQVAAATSPGDEPIIAQNMRGWLLADGLVMLKYTSRNQGRPANRTSLWRRTATGRWQLIITRERPQLAGGRTTAREPAHARAGELAGSPAGQAPTARRTVTTSPSSSPSALRTCAFTGTMYRPSFRNSEVFHPVPLICAVTGIMPQP